MSTNQGNTGKDEPIDQVLKRFEAVIAKQRTIPDLLSLFRRLDESTRFELLHKPVLYAHLVEVAAQRVPDGHVQALIDAIEKSPAAQQIRFYFTDDRADYTLGKVVQRALSIAKKTPASMMEVFRQVERVGISSSRAHTLGIALVSGMSADDVAAIRDFTAELAHSRMEELTEY